MNKTTRDPYFDQLRGLAILAVISIHTTSIIVTYTEKNINFYFLFYFRQFLNFAVAMFLFISGYFLSKTNLTSKKKYLRFVKKQIPKILIPYIFYTTLIILIGLLLHKNYSLNDIIIKYLTGNALGPYYYIILLLQYYLLLPILQKNNNKKGIIIALSINSIFFITLYAHRIQTNNNIPLFYYAGIFPSWIIFFQSGLYIGKFGIKKIKKTISYSIIFLLLLLCFYEARIWLTQTNNISYAISQIRFSSFLFSLAIIYHFITYRIVLNKWLLKLGEYSYGLFLIHMIIMPIINKLLTFIPTISAVQPLYQLICITLTITISYLIINISKRIFSKRINTLFGFNR